MEFIEATGLSEVQQEAVDIVKMFWLLSESRYDKLRKIEGCEG